MAETTKIRIADGEVEPGAAVWVASTLRVRAGKVVRPCGIGVEVTYDSSPFGGIGEWASDVFIDCDKAAIRQVELIRREYARMGKEMEAMRRQLANLGAPLPPTPSPWISTKERMPPVGERVLVADVRRDWWGIGEWSGQQWSDANWHWTLPREEITHWMQSPPLSPASTAAPPHSPSHSGQ